MSYNGIVVINDFYNKPLTDVNKFLNTVSSDTVIFLCLYADKRTDIEGGAYKKSLNAIVNNPKAICYFGDVDLNVFNVMTGKFKRNVFAFRKDAIGDYRIKDTYSFLLFLCNGQTINIDEDIGGNLIYSVKSSKLSENVSEHTVFEYMTIVPTKDMGLALSSNKILEKIAEHVTYLIKSRETGNFKLNSKPHTQYNISCYDYEFNYSKIHNEFLKNYFANRYVILMNDDIECEEETIRELLIPFLFDSKLAVVGAKLYFPDGTIQHVGVKIDKRLGAMHPRRGLPETSGDDSFDTRNCVTFALVAIDLVKYRELNGMDENLPYDFNDIDYCLRCKEKGYRVLYNPQAKAIHKESVTRKADGKCGVKADTEYFKNKHKGLFR